MKFWLNRSKTFWILFFYFIGKRSPRVFLMANQISSWTFLLAYISKTQAYSIYDKKKSRMHSIINHIWKLSLLYFHTWKNTKVTTTVFFKGSKLYVKRDEWCKKQTCLLKWHHYQLSSFPGLLRFVIYSKWFFFSRSIFTEHWKTCRWVHAIGELTFEWITL